MNKRPRWPYLFKKYKHSFNKKRKGTHLSPGLKIASIFLAESQSKNILLNVFLRCCWVLHVEDKQVAYDEYGVEAEERGHRETGPEPVFDVADLLG